MISISSATPAAIRINICPCFALNLPSEVMIGMATSATLAIITNQSKIKMKLEALVPAERSECVAIYQALYEVDSPLRLALTAPQSSPLQLIPKLNQGRSKAMNSTRPPIAQTWPVSPSFFQKALKSKPAPAGAGGCPLY